MDSPSRPPIGVIGIPQLATALGLLGFRVLSHAADIDADPGPVGAIVADGPDADVLTWSEGRANTVVVSPLAAFAAEYAVVLPMRVNDILARVGWGPSPHPLGIAVVDADGVIPDLSRYVPAPVEPEPEPEPEPDGLPAFDAMVEAARRGNRAAAAARTVEPAEASDKKLFGADKLGAAVILYGGKGGVGRTTLALLLSQRASEAGQRVVFVEMKAGFSDARSFLRVGDPTLPTAEVASTEGREPEAVIPADRLNSARRSGLEPIGFAAILAAPSTMRRDAVGAAYARAIAYSRSRADLVVVDTQIPDQDDDLRLTGTVVMPAVQAGAWCLGVTDASTPGREDLLERTKEFVSRGVSRHRLLLAYNQAPFLTAEGLDRVSSGFDEYGTFAGAAGCDPALASAMDDGGLPTSNPAVAELLDSVLFRVTGADAFLRKTAGRRNKGQRSR